MIRINVSKTRAEVVEREPLTSGQVNMIKVKFEFSADWDGLKRIAVFSSGEVTKAYELEEANECFVPAEVTLEKDLMVLCGIYGTKGETLVIPSIYARLGIVEQGANPEDDKITKTPGIWEKTLVKLDAVIEVANKAKTAAENVVDRANRGDFKGDKGNVEFATFDIVDGSLVATYGEDMQTVFVLNENGELEVNVIDFGADLKAIIAEQQEILALQNSYIGGDEA